MGFHTHLMFIIKKNVNEVNKNKLQPAGGAAPFLSVRVKLWGHHMSIILSSGLIRFISVQGSDPMIKHSNHSLLQQLQLKKNRRNKNTSQAKFQHNYSSLTSVCDLTDLNQCIEDNITSCGLMRQEVPSKIKPWLMVPVSLGLLHLWTRLVGSSWSHQLIRLSSCV